MGLDALESQLPAIAAIVWGPPRPGATQTEIRYGDARTVNPQKGRYYRHGDDIGGGPIKMLETELGLTGKAAFDWFREHGFDVDPAPQQMNGHHRQPERPPVRPMPTKPSSPPKADRGEPKRSVEKVYDYVDAGGETVLQTVRFTLTFPDGSKDKTFGQRRKPRESDDPAKIKGGWVWSLNGIETVPYCLPELIEAVASETIVFFGEGEKTVDALRDLGVPATCNPMGAGKWFDELTEHFRDADVVILPDNDPQASKADGTLLFHEDGRPKHAGRDHADLVASKLAGIARRVRVLELPDLPLKGDAFDWIEAGGTVDELYDLVERRARDWTPPAPAAAAIKRHFAGTWFHEISGKKPKRNWLVKNLILARTFGVVFGAPGSGKSFLVADLMLSCAAAALLPEQRPEWFEYKGRPFGVVYVVAEGSDDFAIRLHAWRMENKIPESAVIPFFYLATGIDMRSSDADTLKLADDINAISQEMLDRCGVGVEMVVIDTVARALAGGNENASDVMGAFVINCGKLQELCGTAVIGVHHGGKEAGKGPRGHEALHGAADFEIEVSGATEEGPNQWAVRKLKAGPAGATHNFRLKPLTVSEDDDGDPVTSCVVITPKEPTQQSAAKRAKSEFFHPNPTEATFLHILADAIEQEGQMPAPELKLAANVKLVVNVERVKQMWRERMFNTEDGTEETIEARLRQRWSRTTKTLLQYGVIGSLSPWLFMTGREAKGVRLRGAEPLRKRPEPQAEPERDYGLDDVLGADPDVQL